MRFFRKLFNDLFTQAGKISRTRFWGNIVNVVATFLVIWDTLHSGVLRVEILLIYLGIPEGAAYATKRLEAFNNKNDNNQTQKGEQ